MAKSLIKAEKREPTKKEEKFIKISLIAFLIFILGLSAWSIYSYGYLQLPSAILLFLILIQSVLFFYVIFWNKKRGEHLFNAMLILSVIAYPIIIGVGIKEYLGRVVFSETSNLFPMETIEMTAFAFIVAAVANIACLLLLMLTFPKKLKNTEPKIMAKRAVIVYSAIIVIVSIMLIAAWMYSANAIASKPLSLRITGYDLTKAEKCMQWDSEKKMLKCWF